MSPSRTATCSPSLWGSIRRQRAAVIVAIAIRVIGSVRLGGQVSDVNGSTRTSGPLVPATPAAFASTNATTACRAPSDRPPTVRSVRTRRHQYATAPRYRLPPRSPSPPSPGPSRPPLRACAWLPRADIAGEHRCSRFGSEVGIGNVREILDRLVGGIADLGDGACDRLDVAQVSRHQRSVAHGRAVDDVRAGCRRPPSPARPRFRGRIAGSWFYQSLPEG